MVKVPEPLRVVFDTFPLKTYGPVSKSNEIPGNVFHFKSRNAARTSSKFTLAVHNVRPVSLEEAVKLIPTDPKSLAAALILCHRHSLLLPDSLKEGDSPHCLMPTSYLGSTDNELPMLIESGSGSETVISSASMFELISERYFSKSALASLVNQFVDSLQDLWMFALLCDLPKADPSAFTKIFFDDVEVNETGIVCDLTSLKLVTDIPDWTNFRSRYPHLFQSRSPHLTAPLRLSKESLLEVFAVHDAAAFEQAYFGKLLEFERSLPLFSKFLEEDYDPESKTVIELKLAAFIQCVTHFLPQNTHLRRMLEFKFENEVTKSAQKLLEY